MNPSEIYMKPKIGDDQAQLTAMVSPSYFVSAPQPYPFMGLAHTPVGINPDDFNSESPQEAFDFQAFETYHHPGVSALFHPPAPQSGAPQPGTSSAAVIHDTPESNTDVNSAEVNHDSTNDRDQPRQGSSGDDDDITPAQSRRKAQNRAAQRAFRERKEKHVKQLEAEVAALKQATSNFLSENEDLKLKLQRVSTENEILKATSHVHGGVSSSPLPDTGPILYNPKDFYTDLLHAHDNKTPSHRITTDAVTGGRLLAAGATWEFIISHPLFKRGLVDVISVSERLRPLAKCDGQGPAFEERAIIDAIEKSVASGGDELL